MISKYFFNFSKLSLLCFLTFFLLMSEISIAANADKNSSFISVENDARQISLVDAIMTALENNHTVSIQRLQPQIAKTYVREQSGNFDPELAVSVTRNQTKLQRFLGSRPDPFEMTTDRSQYDASLTEILPTGTSISASASMLSSLSSIYSDNFSGSVGVTITQSLLQGFGTGVNLANLRKANIDFEISKLELKAVAEQVVSSMEQAYWDLYLAGEEIKIQQKSLELIMQQLAESEERVNVGKLAKLELAAVHAEVATRKEALIDAQSNYEQARLNFIFFLNPSVENDWNINPTLINEPYIPIDSLDNIAVHQKLGLKFRADLQQAQLDLQKNKLDITMTKNGLLPRLDFFINLERTTYAFTFREALPELQSPFYSINGGLSFAFPIPNRSNRAQLARARFSQEQMEISLENMKRLVQKDVRSAYTEALRTRQQIEATKMSRELQEQKLLAEREKFRVGKSTNYLVLQAQRDLVASQIDEARAKISHLEALVNLHLMEGTLLDRRGINTLKNKY